MHELPMFPLGTVLVPTAVLPLHVFEPRYRALVTHCLATEREFGVVLIERGSEVGGGDVRSDVGTVAKILEAVELADGRWAIGAVGTRRIRVERWLPDDPYPRAEVVEWPDPPLGPDGAERVGEVAGRLRHALALASEAGDVVTPLDVELSDDSVLAVYQAVAAAPIGPLDRQRLLRAASVQSRIDLLDVLLAEVIEVLQLRLAQG